MTGTSPALSVAGATGDVAFSVLEDGDWNIYRLRAPRDRADLAVPAEARPALLPPEHLRTQYRERPLGLLPGEAPFLHSLLSGQAFMYLHYADMIANGYHRTMPCPFQSQGLLLNPNGDLHYCENSQKLGNVLDESAESLYFKAESLAHREHIKNEICPTCLSPCQVNVGAMKQVVPYVKFLRRAYKVKHAPGRHEETLPKPVG